MRINEFATYYQSGLKKFCIQFENSYAKDLLYSWLKSQNFSIVETTTEDCQSLCFKASLFGKPVYVVPYDSSFWKFLEGKNLQALVVCVAADARTKTAELFQSPPEHEILRSLEADLQSKGCRFTPDGWKALVERFRGDDKKLKDPKGIFHAGYSLGLQTDIIDARAVNTFYGWKVQFWDLFNSILDKNKGKCMMSAHFLLRESSPVEICNGLQKMLTDVLDAKDSSKSGMSTSSFASKKGFTSEYRAQKLYEQAAKLSDRDANVLVQTLNVLEMQLKSKSIFSAEEILKTSLLGYVA
jgi:hypothetical protein